MFEKRYFLTAQTEGVNYFLPDLFSFSYNLHNLKLNLFDAKKK